MAVDKNLPALNGNGLPMAESEVQLVKNGAGAAVADGARLADLDPSKLKITMADTLKEVPLADDLVFGKTMTDHMLFAEYSPEQGWSAPEIRPFGPLTVDPSASCFQYCTNVFEGMKAYVGPDGEPRLFRPELNMARMQTSLRRVALPPFDPHALLALIKKLIVVDRRWIPRAPGCALYVRPTIIGTRPGFGVVASSTHATLYVLLSPTGRFFKVPAGISLMAVSDHVRAWPGGTGGYKLGLNYAPGFAPQREALEKGYQQILWLLDDIVMEAGAMNFFAVLKRADGGLDVVTPPLDGTILPGVTRASALELLAAHASGETSALPNLSHKLRLHTHERTIRMPELVAAAQSGALVETFCVGTAAVVTSIARIGWKGEDIELPVYGGDHIGPVARALGERIVDIQEGRVAWKDWSVPCTADV